MQIIKSWRFFWVLMIAAIITACSSGTCTPQPNPENPPIVTALPNSGGAVVTIPLSKLSIPTGADNTSTEVVLKGGTPGLLIGLSSTVTATPATQKAQQKQLNDSSIPIAVSFNPDTLVAGEVINSDVLVKVTAQLSPGTYYINLYAKYLVDGQEQTVLLGVMTIVVGQVAPTPPAPVDKGVLNITQTANEISVGGTETLVVSLDDSTNVSDLVVNVSSADNAIATVSASSCTLSTVSNSCDITVTGVATGAVDISASATGYTPATTSVTVKNVTQSLSLVFGDSGARGTVAANASVTTTTLGNPFVYSMANGNGTIVAVGENGFIQTSTDNGLTWITRVSNTNGVIQSVAYGNNLFVAVGYEYVNNETKGLILTSPDGVTWTRRGATLPGLSGYQSVTYGNNGWAIAVNDFGLVQKSKCYTSPDGINWSVGQPFDGNINQITFINGQYVAVGYEERIFTSSDPASVAWTQVNKLGIRALNLIGYNSQESFYYTATNRTTIYSSESLTTSPIDWYTYTSPSQPSARTSVSTGSISMVFAGSDVYKTTNKGLTWESSLVQNNGDQVYASVVGNDPNTIIARGYGIYRSTDSGVTWTSLINPLISDYVGAVFSPLGYVSLAKDISGLPVIQKSLDATTWEQITPVGLNIKDPTSLTYVNNEYIMTGAYSIGDSFSLALAVSTDGVTWTTRVIDEDSPCELLGATYAFGKYVAVGEFTDSNGLSYSADNGVTWTIVPDTNVMRSVVASPTKLVAVGDNNIYVSTDGANWSPATTFDNTFRYYKVTYSSQLNQFVAVGNAKGKTVIVTSADGNTWTETYRAETEDYASNFGLAYSTPTNQYIIVDGKGNLYHSANGNEWTKTTTATSYNVAL